MSKPALEELVRLIPPPENPIYTDIDWNAVEADLGLKLPTDYKDFIGRYGNAQLCTSDVLLIVHPLEPKPGTLRKSLIELLDATIKPIPDGRENLSYPDYPSEGGILPVARIFADLLCWITAGSPDEWRMLYWSDYGREVIEYEMGFVQLLVEIFNLRTDLIPDTWLALDNPDRRAIALPIYEQFQQPEEYYRHQQRNG